MSDGHNFVNVLLSDRSHLAPKDSMRSLYKYALVQDARSRSRRLSNAKADMLAALLIFGPPVYYLIKGTIDGCWTALHPENKLSFAFSGIGKSQRLLYRPEIYYKDTQQYLFDLEKEALQKEKAGEKSAIATPLVLWH